MRDHAVLGPAAVTPGFAIPRQAHPAANSLRPLLSWPVVLPACELLAVQKGGRREPGEHGSQQDTCTHLRAIGHEAAEGVLDARDDRCPLVRLRSATGHRCTSDWCANSRWKELDATSTPGSAYFYSRDCYTRPGQEVPCASTRRAATRGYLGRNYRLSFGRRQPTSTTRFFEKPESRQSSEHLAWQRPIASSAALKARHSSSTHGCSDAADCDAVRPTRGFAL